MTTMTFRTRNRKLEQVLFSLGFHHLSWEKDEDGLTVWIYHNDPELQHIVELFKSAEEKRRKAGW